MGKQIHFLIIAVLLPLLLPAQRINLDPAMRPFYHGVASGDPLSNQVMLWTRVTPDSSMGQTIPVYWQIATDTGFQNVVDFGQTEARPEDDYTVKVDVCGLSSDSWYYYTFMAMDRISITGRTRTAPAGKNDSARFAVVSCSSYENGYFNAYADIAERNDVDALIHLGDYIYEYETGGFSSSVAGRTEEPTNEIISLSDYRIRHSHYKLDDQLKRAHQVLPFITTWDDHETANNSWMGGAQNHNAGEGPWAARKANGQRAYSEWMPLRYPFPGDSTIIYRKVRYGDLMDILVLDTRLIGRDEQDLFAAGSSNRSLLGQTQFNWLTQSLSDSSTVWKILAQQVMIAPLQLFGLPLNDDQWDGYAYERDQLTSYVVNNNVDNVVVLTGDIHTSWVNDVPGPGYNSSTGANSRMVEFVVTSVTSPGFPIAAGAGLVQALNPHMKYIDLTEHGYMVVSVSRTRTQADFYYVNTLSSNNFTVNRATSWHTLAGQRHVRSSGGPFVRGINRSNPVLPGLTANQNLPFAKIPALVQDTLMKNSQASTVCIIPGLSCPNRNLYIIDSADYGTVLLSQSCLDYLPDSNFTGRDTIVTVSCQLNAPFQCDTTVIAVWIRGSTTPLYIDTTILPDSVLSLCWQPDDLPNLNDSFLILQSPANGSLTINDSCFSYLPDSAFCGYDTFSIIACPLLPDAACDTLFVNVLVFPEFESEYKLVQIPFDSGFGLCHTFDELSGPISFNGYWQQSSHAATRIVSDSCLTYQSGATGPGTDSLVFWACQSGQPQKCDSLRVGIRLLEPLPSGIYDIPLTVMGAYPNPFEDKFTVQFYVFRAGPLKVSLYDSKGSVLFRREQPHVESGTQYYQITDLQDLPSGKYILELESNRKRYRSMTVKL
jgi:alkaline phosphatase D